MNGNDIRKILKRVKDDPRYLENIEYGKPRRGHAEGTVKAHIAELEDNLDTLNSRGYVTYDHYWALKLLIHVHDTFKAYAIKDSPIVHPQSHASLAMDFLSEFLFDQDMLRIVQYHDLGYALYQQFRNTGKFDEARLRDVFGRIQDKDLFVLFAIIDACTKSKGREGITWFIDQVNRLYPEVTFHAEHIIAGPMLVGEAW